MDTDIIRIKRDMMSDLQNQVKEIKRKIISSKEEFTRYRDAEQGDDEASAEKENALQRINEIAEDVKALKTTYRTKNEEIGALRSEIDYAAHVTANCREQLVLEYDAWYRRTYESDEYLPDEVLERDLMSNHNPNSLNAVTSYMKSSKCDRKNPSIYSSPSEDVANSKQISHKSALFNQTKRAASPAVSSGPRVTINDARENSAEAAYIAALQRRNRKQKGASSHAVI